MSRPEVEAVARALERRGLTLALAESCTGGLIAERITARAGASAFFLAGVVAYANEAKEALLGVRSGTLAREGAVSEAVALEMAAGVRRVSGADFALSVTGIAGPSGGSAEKPVGTVWIALADAAGSRARREHFGGSRSEIRDRTGRAALRWLSTHLSESERA